MGNSLGLSKAIRSLLRNRRFTILAASILALGIGACTAVFSVVERVLLAPLPYPESERVVSLATRYDDIGRTGTRVTGGDWVDLREAPRIFDSASYYYGGLMGVQLPDSSVFAETQFVTPAFFRVFRMPPLLGRYFGEAQEGRAAVVSAAFATKHFGDPQTALGKSLLVEKASYEITGVAPDHLNFPPQAEVWLSEPSTPSNLDRTAFNYKAVARLNADVSLTQAQAGLAALARALASAHPDSNRNKSFAAIPLHDQLAGPVRTTLLFLMASVALLLLIACANVSNLLLARSIARTREFAVRSALGAPRGRIMGQVLLECALLALVGGTLGVALSYVLTGVLTKMAPAGMLNFQPAEVNRSVMLFAIFASAASCLLFGLFPAWQAGRTDVHEALKGGSRSVVGGGSGRMRQALAVGQVALAVLLACGAGLMGRSLAALGAAPLGFQPERLLVMNAHLPAGTDQEYIQVTRQVASILPELSTVPGVLSTAAAMGLPAGRYGSNGAFAVEGMHEFKPGVKLPEAGFRLASPSYFRTMGVPLVAGREFGPSDFFEAPPVAIISKSLAKQVFPSSDPLGRRLKCGLDRDVWMTVVGVVDDVRPSPSQAPGSELYMPLAQHPAYANEIHIVLRTASAPETLIPAVRDLVRRASPSTAISFTTMNRMLEESTSAPRFRAWLAGAFAALALLLSLSGVYAVITFLVGRRTTELGLRMALGASPRDVAAWVVGTTGRLMAAGLVIGLALALMAGRLLASLLFEVQPADSITLAAVAIVTMIAAAGAAASPAIRASRISPVEALRQE